MRWSYDIPHRLHGEKPMSSAKKQVSVTVSKNGPYIVAGDAALTEYVIDANAQGDSLKWQEGKVYDTPAQYGSMSMRSLS